MLIFSSQKSLETKGNKRINRLRGIILSESNNLNYGNHNWNGNIYGKFPKNQNSLEDINISDDTKVSGSSNFSEISNLKEGFTCGTVTD